MVIGFKTIGPINVTDKATGQVERHDIVVLGARSIHDASWELRNSFPECAFGNMSWVAMATTPVSYPKGTIVCDFGKTSVRLAHDRENMEIKNKQAAEIEKLNAKIVDLERTCDVLCHRIDDERIEADLVAKNKLGSAMFGVCGQMTTVLDWMREKGGEMPTQDEWACMQTCMYNLATTLARQAGQTDLAKSIHSELITLKSNQ